ncbi:MAG: hypothetical protein KAR06_07575 [Deltaproteobacteria bacterium]|nr:hypothetical protein [Deltaproteobacteria bacterium]
MATSIKFRNVYSLYDEMDAGIIESLLEEYNIVCVIKGVESFAEDSMDRKDAYTKYIAVEAEKADTAIAIIEDAIESGLISREGAFSKVFA